MVVRQPDAEWFVDLFNYVYDEKYDLQLDKSVLVEAKVQNWNKINGTCLILASICFTYLQQKFYFMAPTMYSLAKGNNEDVILKVLYLLLNSTQSVGL